MKNQDAMVHDHNLSHALLMIIFSILACIAVSLRFWARRIQNLTLTLSDWLILPGLILALGEAGLNIYGCCLPGAWKTQHQASPQYISFVLKLAFLSPIVWVAAVTTIRASVIALYIHIFPGRTFRNISYGILALNILFFASSLLTECLICRPISYRWDYTLRGGTCGNQKARDLSIAITNLLQDAIVVVLPMPILWKLQMATGRKLVVSGILGLGITICVVTAYRVYVSSTITLDPTGTTNREAYSLIALLASLEALLGIVTACSPMLRPIAIAAWNAMPKRSRARISEATSGAGSLLARTGERLNLPSVHSISFMWFSSRSGEYEKQGSVEEGEVVRRGEVGKGFGEKAQIRVRSEFEVESVRGVIV